jgi:hypothetical protein
MTKTPAKPSLPRRKVPGTGATPRARVDARTRELAQLAGRLPQAISQSDYEQAKREVTGETDLDRQGAVRDALPETERWDPIPGSAGHQAPESPSEDEDAEGRSETVQRVDEGAARAGRDQVRESARTDAPDDRTAEERPA